MNSFKFKYNLVKSIMTLCLLASASMYASAEEYKPMIRYDRIWECTSIYWLDLSVKYMRFDGTEEINGKTYHRLITFRKGKWDWDSEGNAVLLNIQDGICEHEGYMREEDGVVYTLVIFSIPDSDLVFGYQYKPDVWDDVDFSQINEKVIYDFNCKPEDTYDGITFNDMEWAYDVPFTVVSTDTVEIDSEKCRRYYAYVFDLQQHALPVIEGIGVVEEGCLNYHAFEGGPAHPYSHHFFNRVFNSEGKELYRTDERFFVDLPYQNFSGTDFVTGVQSDESVSTIYDMMGRRITNPAHGQLYIQNGRKYVGNGQ